MSRPGDPGSGLDATLDVVRRRKWLGLAVFGVLGAMAVAVTVSVPNIYRAKATVLVERDRVSEAFVRSSITAELETRLSTISQELLSRSRLEALILQFGLYPDMRAHAPIEAAVEQMRRDVRLDPKSVEQTGGRPTTIAFTVSYRGRDPRVVADVTNTLASLSVDENARMRERQATGAARLLKLRQELRELRSHYSEKYPDVIRVKTEIAELERELADAPAASVVTTERAAPTDPAVRRLRIALGDAEREIEAARAETDRLVEQMASYQQRAERAAPIEQEFQVLSRDYGATKERYFALIKRYEDALLAETMEQRQPREQFRILDPAVATDAPAAPNRFRLMTIGLVLSLLTAGAAMVLADQIGTPFHSLDSLCALTRVPILASIPIIATAADRRRAARRFWLTAASVTALALIAVKLSSLVAGTQLVVGILTKGAS